jgi:hypothetical protein
MPPKRWLTFNRLHGIISQKIKLFSKHKIRNLYPERGDMTFCFSTTFMRSIETSEQINYLRSHFLKESRLPECDTNHMPSSTAKETTAPSQKHLVCYSKQITNY